MRKLCFLILSISILSCSEKIKKEVKSTQDSITHNSNKAESDNYSITPYLTFPLLDIDTSIQPNQVVTTYNGEIVYKAGWRDRTGENIFIISRTYNYKKENAEIYAYHYLKGKSGWELNWKTYDSIHGVGCDLLIDIPEMFIRITDLDSNAVAETSYIYTLDNRCDAVVVPTKMIIHIGKEKYSIKGFSQLSLGPPEEIMNKYLREQGEPEVSYKKTDDNWNSLPVNFQTYYFTDWDEFSENQR